MLLLERTLARFGIGRLGASSVVMALAMAARGLVVAAYLVLTTRWLGAEGYGMFAGIMTVVMMVATVAGWGASQVVVQEVSVRPGDFSRYWTTALAQIAIVGVVLLAGLLVFAMLMPASWGLPVGALIVIGIAELVALPVAIGAASSLLAVGKSEAAAAMVCVVPLGRLVAVAMGIGFGAPGSVTTVATLHLIGSLGGAIVAAVYVKSLAGDSATQRAPIGRMLRAGTRYVAGNVMTSTYPEIDKLLILALLGTSVLGPYTVAFRAATLMALPVTALMSVSLPRIFAARSDQERRRTLRAVVIAAAAYGSAASLIVALVSPSLPWIFGRDFSAASGYLLLMCPWPLLFAVRQALASGLTGSGRQGERVLVEGCGLLLLAGGCLVFLRSHGASAAILFLLASEALVALVCAWRLRRVPSTTIAG